MKKIYLCALALSVGSITFGQRLNDRVFTELKLRPTIDNGQTKTTGDVNLNDKAPGDVIWSEDFTGGIPAGWTTVDNTGNGFDWVLDPGTANVVGDFTNATPIASVSSGNYMLLNGDGYNVGGGSTDMDAYFQTAAITLNNVGGVSVNFQQKFRRCCAITPAPVFVLAVSTDPTFASNVQEFDIIQGVGGNIQSPDPMNVSVNISAVAANITGDIYLRFHNRSGSSHYYWMIDDIELVESQLNDLVTSAGSYHFFGVQYTRIPVAQIQPASFSMIYNNIGSVTQPNTNLTVDINDGSASVFNLSSTDFDSPSLDNDTINMDSVWTPPTTIGVPYTVTLDILSDSTDFTPTNNTITFPPFEVSQFIMALDDYSTTPGTSGNAGEYEAGNQFDAIVNQQLFSIDVITGSGTNPGAAVVEARLYQIDFNATPFTYTQIDASVSYSPTAGDIGLVHNYLMPTQPMLQAGATYMAVIHSFSADFEYGTSGVGPLPGTPTATHSQIATPDFVTQTTLFSLTATPMVRLNFDPNVGGVGVEELNSAINFNVFPNPSTGEFNINLNANASGNVILTVKNVVGQTIISKTIKVAGQTTETISLSDYSKGVYFLTVGNETVKLIVE